MAQIGAEIIFSILTSSSVHSKLLVFFDVATEGNLFEIKSRRPAFEDYVRKTLL